MTARRRRKAKVQTMSACQFQKVDLDSQIRQSVSSMTPPISGIQGALHLSVTTEQDRGREVVKVVSVPIQNGPAQPIPGTDPVQYAYGDSTWGPCPVDLRSENYHDPVIPGSTLPGTTCVWVAEQGYVEAGQAPPALTLQRQALRNLFNQLMAVLG